MKKSTFAIIVAAMAFLAPVGVSAQREAFPGAEGYGRMTTGGRGGAVYHVTTLEDNNEPGSFRYAVGRSGKRTIVFDVSGTIYLKSELRLKNGDVTIAGQTAPGDGICIADYPFQISANNVIVRFMRFRLGNRQVAYHEGDGLGGMDRKNIIVDHCSVSWSIDECLSVYGSSDITVQWCIASHSLQNSGHSKGAHGYGGNWGGSGASYHHNLIANHSSRTPRLGPRPGTQTDERMDLRNNVIYNYGTNGCYGGEGMNVNIVNNYYKPGLTKNNRKSRIAGIGIRTVDYCLDKDKTASAINASLGTSYKKGDISGGRVDGENVVKFGGKSYVIDMEANNITVDGKTIRVQWNDWKKMLHKWGTFYVKGNVNPQDANVTADNWTTGMYSQVDTKGNDGTFNDEVKNDMRIDTPIEYLYTTTHTAEKAYEKVLAYAGASLHRDEYDEVVTKDVKNGTASFTSTGIIDSQDQVVLPSGTIGWPELKSESAPVDTDGDGIPDYWEIENGLNPNDAADGKILVDGYSNLEIYMNSLVAHIMEEGNKDGKLLSGNLEADDPGVIIPDDPGVTGSNYDLSTDTYLSQDGGTWNFANGFSISNGSGKGYSKGNNGCVKFSKGVQFTINLPAGVNVTSMTVKGYCNYPNNDGYFGEINGLDGSEYVFPKKNPDAVMTVHEVKFDTPVSNTITFTPQGDQLVLAFTLHTSTSAIEDVIISAGDDAEGDGRIYNLQGIEVAEPLQPGVYIMNGKKFVVR